MRSSAASCLVITICNGRIGKVTGPHALDHKSNETFWFASLILMTRANFSCHNGHGKELPKELSMKRRSETFLMWRYHLNFANVFIFGGVIQSYIALGGRFFGYLLALALHGWTKECIWPSQLALCMAMDATCTSLTRGWVLVPIGSGSVYLIR